MPAGRPKIKLTDLPEDWKEKTLSMARNGASDVEIRVEALDCMSNDLWYRLIEEEPEFSETVKKASELCRSWWEKNGRINLENTKFSATLWYMNMKNRFGWKDRQEVDQTITTPKPILIDVQSYNSNQAGNGNVQENPSDIDTMIEELQ